MPANYAPLNLKVASLKAYVAAPPADYRWDRRQVAGTLDFEAIA